ncbi:MAG: glycoside hydrolase family 78 protein [Puniceicoccales bacterium]|jgi:alpha-L-rhamnosidase|nr:glycoside hydrolase family 78 protein [Puniceicoccales bacterium]
MLKKLTCAFVAFSCSLFASGGFAVPLSAAATDGISVENLRLEYLESPLGIDIPAPRFSWVLTSTANGKSQTAYRIKVWEGDREIWDSGRVATNATNQIPYAGRALKAHTKYFWRAIAWDEQNKPSAWSSAATFVTGPLTAADWVPAQWIGEPETRTAKLSGYFGGASASPLLRKEISIPAGKKIAAAYVNATALGIYELYINGKKVGKNIFAPEYTRYDKHLQFQTYDVTNLLQNGGNVIGAALADGWFSGARWQNGRRGGYGPNSEYRKLLARLVVRYTDGTSDTFGTDGSWKYLKDSPLTFDAFFLGETYDARKNPAGWEKVGYNTSAWTAPVVFPKLQAYMADAKLVAQRNEPVAVIREVKPINIRKTGNETYIFDMGQNMTGRCLLRLPYALEKGKTIELRHAEWTRGNGLYEDNLRGARAVDVYIASGDEKEIVFEPRFSYHGFRFVQVQGITQQPDKDTLTGRVVASSSPQVGTFVSSDKKLNKLWENILWTQWGNLLSIPTDCPQRDEREGYTADAQVFAQTACFNLDMAGFYTKWTRDIRDSMVSDKFFPDFAPHDGLSRMKFCQTPGWGDGGVIVPWRVYENYADKRVLEENYEAIEKYVGWLARSQKNRLWSKYRGNNFGDWLRLGGSTDSTLFATGYFYYSTNILAKAAAVLGKTEDAKKYAKVASEVKEAFNKTWVRPNGIVGQNDQPSYGLAFFMDLLPEDDRKKTAASANFVKVTRGRNISAGIHSTAWVMESLAKTGNYTIAYDLIFNRRFPSWFFSIDQGATTIWERWNGYNNGQFGEAKMNSLNHVALGSVGEWLYRHAAGIQLDPANPGYRHFFIRPAPEKRLTSVKCEYESINGKISVEWEYSPSSKDFSLSFKIPVNTTATVIFPDDAGTTKKFLSGTHKWTGKAK